MSDYTIHELMSQIEFVNQKWWVDLETGRPIQRNVGELLMLSVSELAEALEGHRKNLMDDHLSNRKMFDVELADTIIRVLDIANHLAPEVPDIILEKLKYNQTRADHQAESRRLANGKKY